MGIWNKLLFTAVTTLVAAGVMYYLKKHEEDEAYDIDEFDEDFEPEGNVMLSEEEAAEEAAEAPAEKAAEAPAQEAPAEEIPKEAVTVEDIEKAGEDKVVFSGEQKTMDLDGDGKTDAVTVDIDKDGKIDALAVDTDDDGKADKLVIDTDGDGVADTVVTQK